MKTASFPHVILLSDVLVGNEYGVAKIQRTLIQGASPSARLLEVLLVWIRVEGLSDMLWLSQTWITLVQQGDVDPSGQRASNSRRLLKAPGKTRM